MEHLISLRCSSITMDCTQSLVCGGFIVGNEIGQSASELMANEDRHYPTFECSSLKTTKNEQLSKHLMLICFTFESN